MGFYECMPFIPESQDLHNYLVVPLPPQGVAHFFIAPPYPVVQESTDTTCCSASQLTPYMDSKIFFEKNQSPEPKKNWTGLRHSRRNWNL